MCTTQQMCVLQTSPAEPVSQQHVAAALPHHLTSAHSSGHTEMKLILILSSDSVCPQMSENSLPYYSLTLPCIYSVITFSPQ